MRKNSLSNEYYYHIINRSIAGFYIFNNDDEYQRMLDTMVFYQQSSPPTKFSRYMEYSIIKKQKLNRLLSTYEVDSRVVDIVCFCLMPTHFHLILRQNQNSGISKYMSRVENSYTRYFNVKHKRKGPLWESRFKNILIETDDQLLHLTRYIHLNPVSAGLVKKPQNWQFSSYNEYIGGIDLSQKICNYNDVLSINKREYQSFVEERIDYQKEISKIKKYLLENYTG